MTYLLRDNRRQNKTSKWMMVSAIIIFFIIIFSLFFHDFFSSLFQSIGRPLWQAKNSISGKIGTDKESSQIYNYEALMAENATLKEMLGRKPADRNLLLSAILTRPPQSPYDTFIVDVGNDHNVTVGQTAFSEGNIALGKVVQVFPHTSMIKLFSSSGEKLSVLVGTSSVATEAEGLGGSNFRITVPVGTPIVEGDLVTLLGLQSLVLGVVEKIESGANDSFMKVLFKLPVNVSSLRYVEIEKNGT